MAASGVFIHKMEAFPRDNSLKRMDRKLARSEIRNRLHTIDSVLPVLRSRLTPCGLCPRRCAALRDRGETGECGLSDRLKVASVAFHSGEEPPISGTEGAINVFFSGCNLHCLHCQNWPISQQHVGTHLTPEQLAEKILSKWKRGAHGLGWVTPTPQVIPALEAYRHCLLKGFDLPLVHNGGGYEDPEIIDLLAGIVDIWLPDAKTLDSSRALEIQGVADYPDVNIRAIEQMVKQKEQGRARAVIVRHLLLPGGLEDSKQTLQRLRHQFGDRIFISLMVQYFPFHRTLKHRILGRRLTESEYKEITSFARELGFKKGWVQHYDLETGISPHCLS
jgi:putative pyruvate formate lyase activating enzyme